MRLRFLELCCGSLVVVAVIAELIIAWIEPPYITFLSESAVTDAAIAIGIVGEVAFGMWNNRIQTELRTRSNDKLGAAVTGASEANERAAKADLARAELEAKLLPRTLNQDQWVCIRELRKKFVAISIAYEVDVETECSQAR